MLLPHNTNSPIPFLATNNDITGSMFRNSYLYLHSPSARKSWTIPGSCRCHSGRTCKDCNFWAGKEGGWATRGDNFQTHAGRQYTWHSFQVYRICHFHGLDAWQACIWSFLPTYCWRCAGPRWGTDLPRGSELASNYHTEALLRVVDVFGPDEILHEGIDVAYGSRHKVIKPDKFLLNIISTVIPLLPYLMGCDPDEILSQ